MLIQDNFIQSEERKSFSQKFKSQHPLQRLFFVIVFFIGLSIVGFLGLFIFKFHAFSSGVKIFIPRNFILGTILIVLASFCMHSLRVAFSHNQYKIACLFYIASILCGFIFCFSMLAGWREMAFLDHQFALERWNASMMVAIVSLLSFAAVMIACVVTTFLCVKFTKRAFSVVGELLLSTNPFESKRLKFVARFWYFLSLNWLFAFFVFTMAKIY